MTKQNNQLRHALVMHERVKTHKYDYNHPSFKRPTPRRVGMKDTVFACYQASPWLMWMFRNRAWKDEHSRREVLKLLWRRRKEFYADLETAGPDYINFLCCEVYMKPEYMGKFAYEN